MTARQWNGFVILLLVFGVGMLHEDQGWWRFIDFMRGAACLVGWSLINDDTL